MILAYLLTVCLAFGTAQLALASKLAMTRCYCISDTEVGFVSIYNLTTSSPSPADKDSNSSSTVWYRNKTLPRIGSDTQSTCGTECNAARTECWNVPSESFVLPLFTSSFPAQSCHATQHL